MYECVFNIFNNNGWWIVVYVVCRVVIDVMEEYGLVVDELRSIYEINKYTY